MNNSKDFAYISINWHGGRTYKLNVSPAQHYETSNHQLTKLKMQTGSGQGQVNITSLLPLKWDSGAYKYIKMK